MTKMRPDIAMFLPALRMGGAERVFLNLAKGFCDAGYRVDMVLVKAEGPFLSSLDPRVHIEDLNASRTALGAVNLTRYLRRRKPRSLLSTLGHANIVAASAARLANVPRVVTREATIVSKVSSPNTIRLMNAAYQGVDAVVCVSESVKKDLKTFLKVPDHKLHVVYNPCNLASVSERKKVQPEHPWLQGASEERDFDVVVAAGRLSFEKGYDVLFDALHEVRASGRDVRAIVLGEGDARSDLERQVARLGLSDVVAMPGYDDNPYAYVSRADAFVLCSRFEGLPNALIESVAMGIRSVSTNCPGGSAEILEDGALGPLPEVADPSALAKGLVQALDGPAPRPSTEWFERFHPPRVVEQYARLLGL